MKQKQKQQKQERKVTKRGRVLIPWSKEETDLLLDRYVELGLRGLVPLLPNRAPHAIQMKARGLGLTRDETNLKSKRHETPEMMAEEKTILLSEIRFLVGSICSSNERKRSKAMIFIEAMERNSLEWWYERRNWMLGTWCEMFIDGYKHVPIKLNREDFLEGDGVFIEGVKVIA